MLPVAHCYLLKKIGMLDKESILYTIAPDVEFFATKNEEHKIDTDKISDPKLKKSIKIHLILDENIHNDLESLEGKLVRPGFRKSKAHNLIEAYYDVALLNENKDLYKKLRQSLEEIEPGQIKLIANELGFNENEVKRYYKFMNMYIASIAPFNYIKLPKHKDMNKVFEKSEQTYKQR